MCKYIRFKDIPDNEISNIYDGDLGVVGHEKGVSCYEFIKTKAGYFKIILPSISSGPLHDLLYFIDQLERKEIPAYVIEATEVGVGTYGEPVVKDVTIIREIQLIEFTQTKPKFKLDRTNPQLVFVTAK